MIEFPKTDVEFLRIAHIHKGMLHDTGFLAECSEEFIAFFYQSVYSFNTTILLVARNESCSIQGFAFATVKKSEYYRRFFRKHWFSMLFYPSVYIPLAKALVRRSRQGLSVNYEVELVQIAVDQTSQSKGVGRELISAVLEELWHRKTTELYLQVFSDNMAAIALYTKSGFVIACDLTVGGRKKLIMKAQVGLSIQKIEGN